MRLSRTATQAARASPDGLLDLCGFVKPLGRFRQSLWSDRPMVYLCSSTSALAADAKSGTEGPAAGEESWNWPDKAQVAVSCFTNCPEVSLTLNGRTLGTKRLGEAANGVLVWPMPFAPGTLKAEGRKDGRVLCEFELRTAGAAKRIELHPDVTRLRADGRDVCQVEFDVVDGRGRRVPNAAPELNFELIGPAQILGLGNGDVANSEPVEGPAHRAYQGRGLAIVQSSTTAGGIRLTVSGPGLDSATLSMTSR